MKEWHASHTQNLPGKIASLKDRLAVLENCLLYVLKEKYKRIKIALKE